jgi:UDP-N-acetylglucosamine 4,6-dehydratase
MLSDKTVLITDGSNHLSKKFAKILLDDYRPNKLIIFSRDELEQYKMRQEFGNNQHSAIRYFLGDIRDRERLFRAFAGVDFVIHTETLHFPFVAEYNPFEAVKTNILGAIRIIDAAIDQGVDKVISLSPESSVNPATLSGLTEHTSERIFVAGNSYTGSGGPRFSVVRIGSVFGIKNDLVSRFRQMSRSGLISISDPNRSRFWMPYDHIVRFTLFCLENMIKGEIFVPKLPSVRDVDLARAVAPNCERKITGINLGEVLHETLLSQADSQFALEYDDYYAIIPFFLEMGRILYYGPTQGRPCHVGFSYRSNTNSDWMSVEDVQKYLAIENREK